MFVLSVGLFTCFLFPPFQQLTVISADTRLSFFISHSSYPLDLFSIACFNAISILKFSLSSQPICSFLGEHDFSEADSYYFLSEYKLTSPQFTSAHLLGCFLSPFALSLPGFTFSSSFSSIICYLDLLFLLCILFLSSVKPRKQISS